MLEGIGDEFVTVEAASDGDGRGRLGVLMDDIRGVLSGSNADGVMHIVPFEVAEEDGGRCGFPAARRILQSVNRNVTVPVGISDGVALTSCPPSALQRCHRIGTISQQGTGLRVASSPPA